MTYFQGQTVRFRECKSTIDVFASIQILVFKLYRLKKKGAMASHIFLARSVWLRCSVEALLDTFTTRPLERGID